MSDFRTSNLSQERQSELQTKYDEYRLKPYVVDEIDNDLGSYTLKDVIDLVKMSWARELKE